MLLVGGAYHDFEAFERFATTIFGGYHVRVSRDPSSVAHPEADVVVVYTCYLQPPSNPKDSYTYLEGISDEDSAALSEWVHGGGGLLALHSATTIRESNDELQRLYGGRFLSHPPGFPFTVVPMSHEHPVTRGVGSFLVTDELYTQEYGDVDVHMVAVDRGIAHPMVWTRAEGRGHVAHIAPGHDERTWENAAYQQLLRQTVGWLAQR